jgi:cell division protein FtsI/penicillin-binding protein 2
MRWVGATLLAALVFSQAAMPQQTLYTQSLQTILTRTNPRLDFLILDANTHQILANTFPNPSNPIPVGSLTKPFLALAFLTHQPRPALNVVCHGHPDRCWRAVGHGRLTLPEALAQSCNAYFLALARTLPLDEIILPTPPPPSATPEDLIGLTAAWPISPLALATAYAQLLTSPSTPSPVFEGMSLAASKGTASAIGQHPGGVLAKTGTAPCIPTPQRCLAANDGLVLAAVPAQHPTLILLVRRRATTGAITAQSAAHILTQLEALHAY